MKVLERNRAACLGIGVGVALIAVLVLTLVLDKGSATATFLLDRQDASPFPYPLTIQNLMTLMFGVAMGDILHRRLAARVEVRALRQQLLPEGDTVLVPKMLPALLDRNAEQGRRDPAWLNSLIDECVTHFQVNRSTDRTHQVFTSMLDMKLGRLDLSYTLLRYLAWAIPTAGFIGTVVGITSALYALQGEVGSSLMENLEPVLGKLALAFYTTILALALSGILVLLIQFTQSREENAVSSQADYCLRNLINRLYVPDEGAR